MSRKKKVSIFMKLKCPCNSHFIKNVTLILDLDLEFNTNVAKKRIYHKEIPKGYIKYLSLTNRKLLPRLKIFGKYYFFI